jgi:hypothetical protein
VLGFVDLVTNLATEGSLARKAKDGRGELLAALLAMREFGVAHSRKSFSKGK